MGDAAHKLFEWPWWEKPQTSQWPNQHYPTAAGAFTCDAKDAASAVLTYRGLSNGKDSFAGESFTLEVAVDPETGDLLVTPAAESTRGGVYGCGFTLSALAPEITVEAPIFEGKDLDRVITWMPDARGLVNGMTTTQGMAAYFYKAATENPNSIHGTEHVTEVNNVGASLGLGCGIHWGTPGYNVKNRIGPQGSMSWQREIASKTPQPRPSSCARRSPLRPDSPADACSGRIPW